MYISAEPGGGNSGSSSNLKSGDMVSWGVCAPQLCRCSNSPNMHPSAQTSIAPVYLPSDMITSGAR